MSNEQKKIRSAVRRTHAENYMRTSLITSPGSTPATRFPHRITPRPPLAPSPRLIADQKQITHLGAPESERGIHPDAIMDMWEGSNVLYKSLMGTRSKVLKELSPTIRKPYSASQHIYEVLTDWNGQEDRYR